VLTPDDGQRNCPKHVEFYSKNKFKKLVHLVGFTTRIYHERERQMLCLVCEDCAVQDYGSRVKDETSLIASQAIK